MGMLGGPNLAVFFLGVFYPWSNKWGAFFGNLCGITVTVWVYVGSKFYPARPEKLGKLDLWTYRWHLKLNFTLKMYHQSAQIVLSITNNPSFINIMLFHLY